MPQNVDAIRDWFRECPHLQPGNRFGVDYLSADPTEYAIYMQPSTLASFIGTTEFVKACQYTIERIQLLENMPVSLIVYTILMIGYFIICFPLSLASRHMQNKMKKYS